jgi:uncharacterized OB-fold protein
MPKQSEHERRFLDSIAEGKLMVARCGQCARVLSLAERLCSLHPRASLDWFEASGRATLHSRALYRIGYLPEIPPPYVVVMVELEEGPRLVATLSGEDRLEVETGTALVAMFEPSGRLVFATATDNGVQR